MKISDDLLRGGFCGGSFDAEEVVNLTDEDDERDARGESADDGGGNEGNEATEAQYADDEQKNARKQTRDPDALEPVALNEDDQHGRHGACGSADLERRACERSHDEAREDGGD